MESLNFVIVLEADAAGNGWHSCYPAWEDLGAATCGNTREEAIHNIKEVWQSFARRFATEQLLGTKWRHGAACPIPGFNPPLTPLIIRYQ